MNKNAWYKVIHGPKNNEQKSFGHEEQIVCGLKEFGQKSFGQKRIGPSWPRTKMFWTKSICPNVIQDIILLDKFILDKNNLDKPLLDNVILDEVLFPFFASTNQVLIWRSKILFEVWPFLTLDFLTIGQVKKSPWTRFDVWLRITLWQCYFCHLRLFRI